LNLPKNRRARYATDDFEFVSNAINHLTNTTDDDVLRLKNAKSIKRKFLLCWSQFPERSCSNKKLAHDPEKWEPVSRLREAGFGGRRQGRKRSCSNKMLELGSDSIKMDQILVPQFNSIKTANSLAGIYFKIR
jgi:hypothetical protein